MPRKEEKDKRSAVKNLFWARLQILRRSAPQNDNTALALNHFLSGTHSSARPGRLRGSHLRCEPAPGARSETLKHYLPIVRKLRSRLEYATGGNVSRYREKMFGRLRFVEIQSGFSRASRSPAMRRLAKLAPPASARKYLQHCSQNRTRLRLAQLCELPRKQQIPLILPRHYTASGLLNLHTSLTRALTPVTPGVKLPGAKIKQKLFTRKSPPERLEEGRDRGVTRPEIKASGLEMTAQRMT